MKSIIELEKERLEWSKKTFPEATPESCLKKLEEEIAEIRCDMSLGVARAEEYADALMCLLDSAGRQEITVEMIIEEFASKFYINKQRKWIKNPDNTYSHVRSTRMTGYKESVGITTLWKKHLKR